MGTSPPPPLPPPSSNKAPTVTSKTPSTVASSSSAQVATSLGLRRAEWTVSPFSALISTLPVLRSRSIVPSCHFFCRWVRRFVYRQDRCSIAAILDLRVCAWLVSVLETVYSGVYKTGRTLGLAIA